ncbi:MAG TPA: CehA/McbA family metallohydrolase [Nannocystaceae bacterium]|nr:CehA/McbA family metallohydrolase [Nannocystaceae bacterium]
MSARWAALLVVLAPGLARADETVIPLDGEIAAGGLDHAFVEFEVPAGIVEIEVQHDDGSEADILDWGLYDANGFRGWGGGNGEPAIVGIDAASRSYVPGAIAAGTWRVVIGKAKIVNSPVAYTLTVVLRDVATLAPQPERSAYAPVAALSGEARWYAGDFHAHSRESGDAQPSIDELVTFARGRGLDFVELSDHNVLTQLDFVGAVQPEHADILLVPGMEFTTYAGHANAIGATQWVDHKIGQPDVTIAGAFAALHDQGALVSINHPVLDLGDVCIGCAWDHEIDPLSIDAVEIATTGWDAAGRLFDDEAIAFWDDLCDLGAHAAAVAGSDDHSAGASAGAFSSPIGDPTTMVYATELSVDGLLAGIRASRTVVKLQGPADPMVELVALREYEGDTVHADAPVDYEVTVRGGTGFRLRLVRDGDKGGAVDVDADPFVHAFTLESPSDGETRVRAELLDGNSRAVITSHIWQRACAEVCTDPEVGADTTTTGGDTTTTTTAGSSEGGTSSSGGSDGTEGGAAEGGGSGCGCSSGPDRMGLLALSLLGCGWWRRRSRNGYTRDAG